jgi:alcohol dehydrogenase class IV
LRLQLDLDLSLDAFVTSDDDREKLAAAALRSGQVKMNPRLASIEDLRALVQAMRKPTGNNAPTLHL